MASKGQKFNKYNNEFKNKVIQDYLNGEGGAKTLAKRYSISYHSIETWIRKYKRDGTLKTVEDHRGRPKNKSIDYKERYEILKKYQAFLKAQQDKKWYLLVYISINTNCLTCVLY